jgi:hypothetical protein
MIVGQLFFVLNFLADALDLGLLKLIDTIFVSFDLTLVILDHICDVLNGLIGEFAFEGSPSRDRKTFGLSDTMVHQNVDNFVSFLQLLLLLIGLLFFCELANRSIILIILHNFD